MIVGIHHIAMNTSNFDRQVAFYQKAFGFKPVVRETCWSDNALVDSVIGVKGSAARMILLNAGNAYLEIFEYSAPEPRAAGSAAPNDRGYTHFCVEVTDIETEYQRLVEAGMTFPRETPGDMGNVKAIYGKDPDGNVIEIQQCDETHPFAFNRLPNVDIGVPKPAVKGEDTLFIPSEEE